MTFPARRAAAVLALAGLLAAGCSSSGGTKAGSSPAAGSSAATGSSSSTTSSAPAAAGSSSKIVEHGDSGSTFCTTARQVSASEEKQASQLTDGNPADVKKFVQQAEAALAIFQNVAPSAIKSDVGVIVSATKKLYAELQANGYDFRKAATSKAVAALKTPAVESASQHVSAYLSQVCKIKSS